MLQGPLPLPRVIVLKEVGTVVAGPLELNRVEAPRHACKGEGVWVDRHPLEGREGAKHVRVGQIVDIRLGQEGFEFVQT